MKVITKDDLASLIDVDKLKSIVEERKEAVADMVKKDEVEEKSTKSIVKTVLIVCGVIAGICGIAYALYRYFKPDYDDEFDDDFDDAFDDDDDDLFEEDAK